VSKQSIKSDLPRLDRMKDADIDYADIPPLDKSFFTKATEAWPPAKQQHTIRLDADVWRGSSRTAGAIRHTSIVFCGVQWKATLAVRFVPHRRRRRRRPDHAAT
jgi:hypothetical protein